MSVSITNTGPSLPPPSMTTSMAPMDAPKNAEPLAVRGLSSSMDEDRSRELCVSSHASVQAGTLSERSRLCRRGSIVIVRSLSRWTVTRHRHGKRSVRLEPSAVITVQFRVRFPPSFLVLIAFLVFRNVFLGEVFSAIVSLHNQSEHLLKEVLLKVRRSICFFGRWRSLFVRQTSKQQHNGSL